MAIVTENPLEFDGKTYNLLGVSLAISPLWSESGVGCSVALQAAPYRFDESGQVEKPLKEDENGPVPGSEYDFARSAVYLNVFESATDDPDLAEAVQTISMALQKLITAKYI
jgi:hypothetical protein